MVKVFTMVKGEADIVEDWVLYHGSLFGYENLYIIDNYSLDGTFKVLIGLNKKYNINITRLPNYKKKGDYMTYLLRSVAKDEIVFPIDIDEFIVYYDKTNKLINCDTFFINNYVNSFPQFPVFKMNYINSKILKLNGYDRATRECKYGLYEDYGEYAKTCFRSNLFKDKIDHGNHYPTNKYILTNLCLIHFHTRNLDQIKKKVYNNVKGLGHDPFNLQNLKMNLKNEPSMFGWHHIDKQIKILEKTFVISVEAANSEDIDFTPFNNYISNLCSENKN